MDTVEYLDFELRLEGGEQGYNVSVRSPGGEAKEEFALPFSDLELENFLLKVGRTRRGVRRIGSPEMEAARSFGGKLFEAVFKGGVLGCFERSRAIATNEDKGLRIKLRFPDTPKLACLPWEYLYRPFPLNRFLSLGPDTPIVRYIELPEPIAPLEVELPLRILVMISSPSDYPELDVAQERANLQSALSDIERRGMAKLEWLEQATLEALLRRLELDQYHIFHFIGHGGFDERAQDGLLLMEDGLGCGRVVSAQYVGMLLHDHPSLRLAVLNACEGARSSLTDPFAGTATALVQQGVPAVVAMQFEITDEAAIAFAREFYAAMAHGHPVDASLAEARKALRYTGNDVEWGTPVLYMRSPDGRIFGVERIIDEETLGARYLEGKEALVARDWQKAINKFSDVVGLDASYKDAQALLAQAKERLEQEREKRLSELYAMAMKAKKAKDWAQVISTCEEMQIIDRQYKDVDSLLKQAQAEKEREHRLGSLYKKAMQAQSEHDWDAAIALYRKIQATDPRYKNVTTNLEEARRAKRAREQERQLTERYARALEYCQARRWADAVDTFRAVLKIDPGYRDAADRLAEARREEEVASLPPPPKKSPPKPVGPPEETRGARKTKPKGLPR